MYSVLLILVLNVIKLNVHAVYNDKVTSNNYKLAMMSV